MPANDAAQSNKRVAAHRDRMRRQGLRPIQLWVPDVRTPEFKREARRQSMLVAASAHEQDDLDWVESVAIPFDELDEE